MRMQPSSITRRKEGRPANRIARQAICCFVYFCLLFQSAPTSAAPFRPVKVTGLPEPRLKSFDALMTDFVGDRRVPGGSLAIAKDGRLIYARGFGWANKEKTIAVTPDSRFRIASISKPITAAAILKLAQDDKLDLDEPAWNYLPPQARPEKSNLADKRVLSITTQQLLHHTAGFDRKTSFDPMFRARKIAASLGLSSRPAPNEILRYVLERPLDFDPGSRYAYSNIGYNALGRIIEHVSQKPYEIYCQNQILAPLGITGMRLGRTLPEDRAPGEVWYTGHGRTAPSVFTSKEGNSAVPLPYGAWDLESMDSHGGWIASAPELVRFGDHLLRSPLSPLGPESLERLHGAPSGLAGHEENGIQRIVYYGCGWSVRHVPGKGINRWHNGLLDGTASLLVVRHDGLTWAVLFNSRSGSGKKRSNLGAAIDSLLHRAAAEVSDWPARRDLFPLYLQTPSRSKPAQETRAKEAR